MTPIAALENHARALNEALEDCRGYTADDFRRVCYARMCECLGIPLRDQGLVLKLSKRRGSARCGGWCTRRASGSTCRRRR
jgi:hypothetical protein